MTCAALAAMAAAVVINTQRSPELSASDQIVLAPSDTAWAELCVHNHEAQVSHFDRFFLELDGHRVTVDVYMTPGTGERIVVTPPAGFMVWPAEDADFLIEDGESRTVQIVMGVS